MSATGLRWGALTPVAVLWVLWFGALGVTLVRTSLGVGLSLVALGVRAATWAPRVHMHGVKSWGLLEAPFTDHGPDLRYGEGWAAVMDLGRALTGGAPDVVHLVNGALATLAAPLVGLAVASGWGRRAGAVAGGIVATLPILVAFGPTEIRTVTALPLLAGAWLGIARPRGAASLLGALSVGLLAHTNPLAIGGAWVWVLAAAGRSRPMAVAGGVAVAWRTLELGVYALSGGNLGGSMVDAPYPQLLREHPWGRDAHLVLLDPTRVPWALTLLAVIGALAVARRPGGWGVLVAAAIDLALAVPQTLQPDRMRYQLPSLLWVAALAGVGLAAPGRWAAARALVGGILLVSSVPAALRPLAPPWVWQREHEIALEALEHVRPGETVRVGGPPGLARALATWAERRTGAHWREGSPQAGELRWVGAVDLEPGAPPVPWSRLEPVHTALVQAEWGGIGGHLEPVVRVGLYRAWEGPSETAR